MECMFTRPVLYLQHAPGQLFGSDRYDDDDDDDHITAL